MNDELAGESPKSKVESR